jgi:2-keto-4-pentenoate hydratase/2-oxohepta-3-ene-1,7-dioic acid hydratase in catechol pathway
MYHSFGDIIEHVSQDETLYPGDILGSGTVGKGCGLELDRWIQPGDSIELEVEGIGTLRHRVIKTD